MTAELPKPRHGDPCNGCGACCKAELCDLGSHVFSRIHGPCPALEFFEGTYRCGLVVNPTFYRDGKFTELSEAAFVLIGGGFACDAQLKDEPKARGWDARIRRHRRDLRERVLKAMVTWGMRPWRSSAWR